MVNSITMLLSLATSAERRSWFAQHYPTKDEALLQALLEESYQRSEDDPTTALVIHQAVADAATFWCDPPTQALALRIEANTRSLLGEHAVAVDLYAESVATFRAHNMGVDAARAVVGQFDSLMYLGRYEEATAQADWAVHEFRAAGDPVDLGAMLANRGNLFARRNQYDQARHDFAEARTHFAQAGNTQYLAMVETNEASLLRELNDFRQAERLFQQARARFQEVGNNRASAHVDHSLASLYLAQGDYQQALLASKRARDIFAAQESMIDVAFVDLDRSEIYLALNLWQEALDLSRSARQGFVEAQMAWESARLWLNEATAQARLSDPQQASTALAQARQLFSQTQNHVWLAVTDLYQATFDLRANQVAAARVAAQSAQSIFESAGLPNRAAQCEIILGQLALKEKDPQQAERHFIQGLALVETLDLPTVSFACERGLGLVRRSQGQTEAALAHYRRAIAEIERLQATIGADDHKIAFRSDKLQVYEAAVLLCLALNTPEGEAEAFATVAKAKSRTLLDALAREPAQAVATAAADFQVAAAELKRELNWYYNRLNTPDPESAERTPAQIKELTTAISQRERALHQLLNHWRSPELAAAPHNPLWTVGARQLGMALPPEALLIEFFIAGEQIIVFGLSQAGLWSQRLPVTRADLVEPLHQFHFQINKLTYGPTYRQRHAAILLQGVNDSLQQLYQALLQPLSDKLEAALLIIAPHDLLHGVPFHALFDGKRYLLESKSVVYAPSASVLYQVLQQPVEQTLGVPRILGVTDPTIPYAQAEAEALALLFPQAQSFIGTAATVDSLLDDRQRPAFLHLSTHAKFRADNPLFSALKLADGWATVNDIYGLSNVAPLITLSACETGRNQISVGDELVGLCRGFFSAGAQSLVVSQWAVDDDSTARLMTYFYQYLRDGQTVAQALRSAQLLIFAEYPHPYYWAPFFLTGNPWTYLSIR